MSLRILIVDRLREIARVLEATACYAIPLEGGDPNWSDPIHVLREADATASPRSSLMMLRDLAGKAKRDGSAFETTPGSHALFLPVPFNGKQVALACVLVRADDRLAYYMLRLARLMLERDDDYSGGPEGTEDRVA